MKYSINVNEIIITETDIDLKKTFDCGQCFRFEERDGIFEGVAFGKLLRCRQVGKDSIVLECGEEDFLSLWSDFLDLEGDYGQAKEFLSFDKTMLDAMAAGSGIHIMHQDPWETLCSFIISQNNNIPRIKKIISALCTFLGEEIGDGVYSFPTAEKILAAGEEGLAPIKSGFRAKYLLDAAKKVASGELVLEALKGLDRETALKRLMDVKGVGPKVASCIALFSLGYTDAFPVDVWVKRIIAAYYGEGFDPAVFGKHAGLAQQYLFYYEREKSKA